jgi:hypothetical protein
MNPLELAAQKIVISLLQDIEKSHLEIGRLVTFGKVSDAAIEKCNQDVLRAIKMLHPMFDVAHALIPESMPILHDLMDWCQAMYHQVVEPSIK